MDLSRYKTISNGFIKRFSIVKKAPHFCDALNK